MSRCPECQQPTRLRKFALVIHVYGLMALGKTSRFCPRCDLVMVHQDELEHELTTAFESRNPHIIGNEYAVLGIMDRDAWRKNFKGSTGAPCSTT